VTRYNPYFALLIALFVNTLALMGLIYHQFDMFDIVAFIVINFCIKVLPILSIKDKKIKKRDIFFTILLYCIFLVWLKVNKFPIKMHWSPKKPLDAPMVNWIRYMFRKK
jgi:hypothetical protein